MASPIPARSSGSAREHAAMAESHGFGHADTGIPDDVIAGILSGYALPVDGIHGVAHWGRVLETGLRLAGATGADVEVVRWFAVFHDARRLSEAADPDHGRRGAELAMRFAPRLGLSAERRAQLAFACAHHADGITRGDVTVRTCWDADRLDLWRVGITPRPRLLCTGAARDQEILAWCRRRSVQGHVPECAAEWITAAARVGREASAGTKRPEGS